MTDSELIAALEQGPHAHLLPMELVDLPQSGFDAQDRHLFIDVRQRHYADLTLYHALWAKNTKREIKSAVRRFALAMLDTPPTEHGKQGLAFLATAPISSLQEWAVENGLVWALGAPPKALNLTSKTPGEQHTLKRYSHPGWTLQTLLRTIDYPSPLNKGLRQRVAEGLLRCAEARDSWVTAYTEHRAAIAGALTDDNVGAWMRKALAILDHQSASGEVGAVVDTEVRIDPTALRATVAEWSCSLTDSWDGTLPSAYRYDATDPYYQVVAADALLQIALSIVSDTPDAAAARHAMNLPEWHRALHHMDAHLSRTPADDGRVVVFRVETTDSTITIEAGSAILTKDGRYRARQERSYSAVFDTIATAQDRTILRALHRSTSARGSAYAIAEALIGHPRVVLHSAKGEPPISVRRAVLGLTLDRQHGAIHARWTLNGTLQPTARIHLAALSASKTADGLLLHDQTGLLVIPCAPELRAVIAVMAEHFDTVTDDAAAPLLARLDGLNALVNVTLSEQLRGELVEGDDRLVVRARFDGGLRLALGVRPLPETSTHLPGTGPTTLHTVRDGQPVYVQRDLSAEVTTANAFAQTLGLSAETEPFTWLLDDLDAALSAVQGLAETQHRLELDGSLPRTGTLAPSSMTVQVRKDRGWFTVGGRASSSLGDVELDVLLAAVDDGRDWVSTSSGYVRLNQTLKDAISGLNATRNRGQVALSAVHVPLLEAMSDAGASVDGIDEWLTLAERVRESATLNPFVPRSLNGTLRSYQSDGFQWMARLAHWAPGAVLADDMGLGKTIQSIALLLRRAGDGPALVVAPTSVGFNWLAELERFAPTLEALSYRGSDRDSTLDALTEGQVLVTSYGIMVRDADVLAKTRFATVIFDEAQALKNPASQRAKAAIALNADFRLALSGTPVENHVNDLWSLFACSARGLLGSHAAFRERWAKPIDAGDKDRRHALARVVSPFMLRRTKAVVAPELPDRTEVVHRVQLTAEHRALYERSRVLALARIAEADPKTARFKVLAELTRLRQMAADPRLSDPTSPVVGGKVQHLVRRLEDLRESGDKALVFSTFVRHLALARDTLVERGFRVAWLTGATSAEARAEAVAQFQDGKADVFLLSTKAGGTGLNLTAASYVFHMDPWWNPAAEDQATDRAHRIGQDKPVTVYRLIAADTVEEKILAMQAEKRELMDALLSDSDSSSSLTLDALQDLLLGT